MTNSDLHNIILSHKKDLQDIGYKLDDDNLYQIVNGFINIANSMINDNTRQIPNLNMGNFLLKLSPYKVEFYKPNIEKLFENTTFDTTVKFEISFPKKRFKGLAEIMKVENNKSIINNFYDDLEKGNHHLIIDKTINKKELIKILKEMKLMDKFHKGELTEKENKIIIQLLNI